MKSYNSANFILILNIVISWTISAKSPAKDGEVEVNLQFLEYELEDFCVSKSEAEWRFLNGSDHDLKKLLDVEMKESEFFKRELQVLQKHANKRFLNKRLQRLMDIFSRPGAPLLGNMEFKEYRDYSIKLQEIVGTMKVSYFEDESFKPSTNKNSIFNVSTQSNNYNTNYKNIDRILYEEKNEETLKKVWIKWYKILQEKNKKTKYDFVQQLSILDLEAEQNGEEDLSEYWRKQTDTTWITYETAKNLWEEIFPLYEKLQEFMLTLVKQNFKINNKKLPVHVLGSRISYDWVTAAEKLGAFDTSETYKSWLQSLKQKTVEDLYKTADNLTGEIKVGYLPKSFYEKSCFNASSQTCKHKMMNYCERENVFRAMFCFNETLSIRHYIEINKNVMRLKYLMLSGQEEENNGYLFREGPRDSVLFEAMESLSSLRALWPENLESKEQLTNQSQQQKTILSLLITALNEIPPLPYYLLSDLWRINALKEIDVSVGENVDTTTTSITSTLHNLKKRETENKEVEDEESLKKWNTNFDEANSNEGGKTYGTVNLTSDWWSFREMYQGAVSPDMGLYEDYLEDENIIWNKAYLRKFLGKILQFQILEKTGNLTTNLPEIQSMLRKGKSESWEQLIEETLNITEISAKPLLKYFKPLDEFFEKRHKFKNHNSIFSFDDSFFTPEGFSLNPISNEGEGEKPAEGSDALFFSFAAIAAVGIVAIIVTIGRKRYKRQRVKERKRRLAEL